MSTVGNNAETNQTLSVINIADIMLDDIDEIARETIRRYHAKLQQRKNPPKDLNLERDATAFINGLKAAGIVKKGSIGLARSATWKGLRNNSTNNFFPLGISLLFKQVCQEHGIPHYSLRHLNKKYPSLNWATLTPVNIDPRLTDTRNQRNARHIAELIILKKNLQTDGYEPITKAAPEDPKRLERPRITTRSYLGKEPKKLSSPNKTFVINLSDEFKSAAKLTRGQVSAIKNALGRNFAFQKKLEAVARSVLYSGKYIRIVSNKNDRAPIITFAFQENANGEKFLPPTSRPKKFTAEEISQAESEIISSKEIQEHAITIIIDIRSEAFNSEDKQRIKGIIQEHFLPS